MGHPLRRGGPSLFRLLLVLARVYRHSLGVKAKPPAPTGQALACGLDSTEASPVPFALTNEGIPPRFETAAMPQGETP